MELQDNWNQPIDVLSDNKSSVTLVDFMSHDHPLKVVNAARISFNNTSDDFSEKDAKLTNYLWEHEHTSPFRHSYYSFEIKAPLFVFRQWIKYQVGSTWSVIEANGEESTISQYDLIFDDDKGCSWNEQSGRYAKFEPEFYIPKTWRGQDKENKQVSVPLGFGFPHEDWTKTYTNATKQLYDLYLTALDTGISKEQARMILPQNIYTKAIWTVSLQSVLWFLHQRLHKGAQHEIRLYANAIKKLIQPDLDKMRIKIDEC